MYGALLADQCNVGDVKLEKDGTPMLFWKEKWSPICGHYFWDNQHGATTFCKKLGYSSGQQERANTNYDEISIIIGTCQQDQDLAECNDLRNNLASIYWGKGGPAIRITCEGHTSGTALSSCGGISQITNARLNMIFVLDIHLVTWFLKICN